MRSTDAVISPNGSGVRADVGSRPEEAPPAATAPRFDPRTRVLLEGPIVSTLLRLATPNVLVMFVQASVGLIETYFVAKLGTDARGGRNHKLPDRSSGSELATFNVERLEKVPCSYATAEGADGQRRCSRSTARD